MKIFISLICGIFFGAGLVLSQMVNPNKVLNFLDIIGNWDPSLALVMAGALSVFSFGYFLMIKPKQQLNSDQTLCVPQKQTLDKNLIFGAILFGIGWGIIGICPGPAWVNLLTGNIKIVGFFVAMLVGMQLSSVFLIKKHE